MILINNWYIPNQNGHGVINPNIESLREGKQGNEQNKTQNF